MAKNNADNLIERDPLAWMDDSEGPTGEPDLQGGLAAAQENQAVLVEEDRAEDREPVLEETLAEPVDKIVLQRTSNIQGVADLSKQLIHLVGHGKTIEIDASRVESVDTATLQVLVAAARQARHLQKEFTIIEPSPGFMDAARLLDVAEDLQVK